MLANYESHISIDYPKGGRSFTDLSYWCSGNIAGHVKWFKNLTRTMEEIDDFVVCCEWGDVKLDAVRGYVSNDVALIARKKWLVTRTKIECEPWAPIVNSPPEHYWEGHVQVIGELPVVEWAWQNGLHVSRDVTESSVNSEIQPTTILTMRSSEFDRPEFELNLQVACSRLMNMGVKLGKTQIEYCVEDSNPQVDDRWFRP